MNLQAKATKVKIEMDDLVGLCVEIGQKPDEQKLGLVQNFIHLGQLTYKFQQAQDEGDFDVRKTDQ